VLIKIQSKKGATAEKTKVKAQTKEAKEYENLLEELSELQVTHILWRLYHIEKVI
jgi:chromosome segregation ATPase